MEGHVLSGDTFRGEDAAVLRGAFSDDGNQLQLPAYPQREDARELVGEYPGEISIQSQGVVGNHALSEIARLHRGGGKICKSADDFG